MLVFFLYKMISAKTRYKTCNKKFWPIIEIFKTWQHYIEGCKHEIFCLIDHNNFYYFMDIKNLSFRQVQCMQELSRYHLQIDYCQGKCNEVANALFKYSQWNTEKNTIFQAGKQQDLAPSAVLSGQIIRLISRQFLFPPSDLDICHINHGLTVLILEVISGDLS